MEFHEFNDQYVIARERLLEDETTDLAVEQNRLRAMVRLLSTDDERGVAMDLVEGLARQTEPLAPPSPEMIEATHLLDLAATAEGTTEERLAILADTRENVWAIADRAGADSAAIQSLTRMLDHQEEELTDPFPWPDRPPETGTTR